MECILSLNCGTSSVKYALYNWADRTLLAKGAVERVTIGQSFIRHQVRLPCEKEFKIAHECPNHTEAIRLIFQALSGELEPEGRVISQPRADPCRRPPGSSRRVQIREERPGHRGGVRCYWRDGRLRAPAQPGATWRASTP